MIVHTTDAEFEAQVLKSDKPVLVDFWAEWCQPCRTMEPVLEEISNDYKDKVTIAKVNVDENPELSQHFNVMSIPTMMLFKGGKPVDQLIGAMPKANITPHLDAVV